MRYSNTARRDGLGSTRDRRTPLTQDACSAARATGLLGISGALCLIVGDSLITPSLSRPDPDLHHLLALRAGVGSTQLYTSGLLGGLGAIFYAVGAWHVHYAIRPAGARLAGASVASLAAMLVATGVYHALFVALNFGARVAAVPDVGPAAAAVALELPQQYASLALRILVIPPAVVFTLLSGVAIVSGRTRYPRWFVLVSPFVVLAAYTLLAAITGPSGVLSFALLGNVYNLSVLLFFVASTVRLWACPHPERDGGR